MTTPVSVALVPVHASCPKSQDTLNFCEELRARTLHVGIEYKAPPRDFQPVR